MTGQESVAVVGGGIGGLTAAHELRERGFAVDVYEAREIFGGKARSFPVDEPGVEGLPGEHGFRFLPGFYRHLRDTMTRIPYDGNRRGVRDNLVETTELMKAKTGGENVTASAELPGSPTELKNTLERMFWRDEVPDREHDFFLNRFHLLVTSCERRWNTEHENTSWWEFTRAEEMSEAYRKHLVRGATKLLVAMDPEKSSTRTIGKMTEQTFYDIVDPDRNVEILDAPTNEAWIDPWTSYLEDQDVCLHPDEPVQRLEFDGEKITSVETTDATVEADQYVLATPIEAALDLVTPEMQDAAPELRQMTNLHTDWMSGIQFYLNRELDLSHGHGIYFDSPWALTSIHQNQFWSRKVSSYGDGEVEDILSICISDWSTPGVETGKPADECTESEIRREVWSQLQRHLGEDAPDESEVVGYHLAPGITHENGETRNSEPLLVNTVGSRRHRPPADTAIPNLYLAADYVRTETDLATMEGANEAARDAVTGLIERSSHSSRPPKTWSLPQKKLFHPLKAHDRVRYGLGLPHIAETTGKLWKKRATG